jgi:hypothetical protein
VSRVLPVLQGFDELSGDIGTPQASDQAVQAIEPPVVTAVVMLPLPSSAR